METKEAIKIAEEDLKGLTDLRNRYAEITANIGRLNLDKYQVEDRLEFLTGEIDKQKTAYNETVKNEQELVNNLNEKYGQGRIDLENGTFTPDK
jgi:predicted nuclease with TOPRIM domain